mgnify:CR=1 FL=1
MKQKIKKLSSKDFTGLLEKELSPYVKNKIKEYDFQYMEVTEDERDSIIKKIVFTLLDPFLVYSGKHRLTQWEKGWGQNLEEYTINKKRKSIIPRYFGKYPVVRINQRWIKPASKDFEYNMLGIILDWLFDKYTRTAKDIYEFGCGTGHNLIRLRRTNPNANLYGLDWSTSSQKLISAYANWHKDTKLFSHRFDYFSPDKKFKLEKDAVIYTVASLEQIGDKHEKFINYLLAQKPKLCIHVEPITEVLDENNLLDYLSIEYFKKRKYLKDFLARLQELEAEGTIKIHNTQRTLIGSFFIEGYSVIVWSPK